MWRKIVAVGLVLALPGAASAGPIKESAEKATRELALAQAESEPRSRSRFWTGIALIAGGGVLTHSAASSWATTKPDPMTTRM